MRMHMHGIPLITHECHSTGLSQPKRKGQYWCARVAAIIKS